MSERQHITVRFTDEERSAARERAEKRRQEHEAEARKRREEREAKRKAR